MRVLQLTVLFALYVVRESSGAGRVRVRVPAWRTRGQNALLVCEHELAGPLYSLKWYRDNEEFYRYMPRQSPPHHSYRLDGIRVDLALSDARHVALRPLSLRSSGVFRCEVSAEAPSFASAHAEARMDVIFLPKEDPRITGQQERYQLADTLELNCTTSRSYPAATLQWFIGDMQVVDRSMLVPYPATLHAHGLASSTLGLRVPAAVLPPAAAVRCRASLALPAGDGEADSFAASDSITPIIETREVVLTVRSSGSHAKPSFGVILLLLATSLARIT